MPIEVSSFCFFSLVEGFDKLLYLTEMWSKVFVLLILFSKEVVYQNSCDTTLKSYLVGYTKFLRENWEYYDSFEYALVIFG